MRDMTWLSSVDVYNLLRDFWYPIEDEDIALTLDVPIEWVHECLTKLARRGSAVRTGDSWVRFP